MRGTKTLGNFLWDMEQYLEQLELASEEAKIKVATQFLTKDAKMWWMQRVDHISHVDVEDISTCEEMMQELLYNFNPQDEMWDS